MYSFKSINRPFDEELSQPDVYVSNGGYTLLQPNIVPAVPTFPLVRVLIQCYRISLLSTLRLQKVRVQQQQHLS